MVTKSSPADPLEGVVFLKMSEVAAALRLNRRTIEKLIAAGNFPRPLHFGPRAVRFVASEVHAYLRNRLQQRGRALSEGEQYA